MSKGLRSAFASGNVVPSNIGAMVELSIPAGPLFTSS